MRNVQVGKRDGWAIDIAIRQLAGSDHFESVSVGDRLSDLGLVKFKNIFSRYDETFKDKGWLSIFLANHDQPRMINKFGNDKPEYRELSSKMLTTFIMTMRGTAFYYNGDEIGMTNAKFNSIDDYRDVDTRNKYFGLKQKGGDLAAFLEGQKQTSRENGRTPFQWDLTQNAGFTTGNPWLKMNQNFTTINAEVQENDQNSVLNYFRKIVKLRKNNPVLVYGKYTLLDNENTKVFAFTREFESKKILILLNFSADNATVNTGIDTNKYSILCSNYIHSDSINKTILRPYEALIIEIN